MKYIVRIIALPFIFIIILISTILDIFKNLSLFVKFGGEWMTYKEDRNTVQDVYNEIRKSR